MSLWQYPDKLGREETELLAEGVEKLATQIRPIQDAVDSLLSANFSSYIVWDHTCAKNIKVGEINVKQAKIFSFVLEARLVNLQTCPHVILITHNEFGLQKFVYLLRMMNDPQYREPVSLHQSC